MSHRYPPQPQSKATVPVTMDNAHHFLSGRPSGTFFNIPILLPITQSYYRAYGDYGKGTLMQGVGGFGGGWHGFDVLLRTHFVVLI